MKHLDYCLQKAKEIPYVRHQQRHYAIVVDKRGRKLSEGKNDYYKTSPKMMRVAKKLGLDEKIFCHAEASAIFKLRNPEKAYKIVVARVLADGSPANSKPCPICEELCKKIGIKSVEYTI